MPDLTWEPLTIAGKPVLRRTGQPGRQAVLILHDLNPTHLLSLESWCPTSTLIAPLGGESLWTPRPCQSFDATRTAEQFLLEAVLPWMAEPHAPLVAIVGWGVGGWAALRLAFQNSGRLPIVASLDAVIDLHDWHGQGTPLDELYDRPESLRQDSPIVFVRPPLIPRTIWLGCPPASENLRGHDRLREKLAAVGGAHTFLTAPPEVLKQELAQVLPDLMAQQARRLLG